MGAAQTTLANGTAGSGGAIMLMAGGDINVSDPLSSLSSFSIVGNSDGNGTASSGELNTGNGGAITLTAGGNINMAGVIASTSGVRQNGLLATSSSGNGGAINLNAGDNITTGTDFGTGNISIFAIDSRSGSGSGGALSLISNNSSIDTSAGRINSSSVSGTGGAINFSASANIITASDVTYTGVPFFALDSRSLGSGSGGAISLTSTNDNINTSAGTINSSSVLEGNGSSGDGGNITITANSGSLTTGNIFSFSEVTEGDSGKGGNITLMARNEITAGDISARSQVDQNGNARDGGAITLTSGGDINAVRLQSASQTNPDTSVTPMTSTTGKGGEVSIDTDGNINIARIDTRSQVIGSNVTNSSSGQGGAITLNVDGNINIDNSVFSDFLPGLFSFSRVGGGNSNGTASDGGTITLDAGGNINIAGNLSILSGIHSESLVTGDGTAGNGGKVTFNATGNIDLNNISSSSSVLRNGNASNGGEISLTSTNGSVNTVFLESGYLRSGGSSGQAGIISLTARDNITNTDKIDASSGNQAGNITLSSTSGNIDLSQASLLSKTASVNGGNISLTASGDIITGIDRNIDDIPSFALDSRSLGSGLGGEIRLTSNGGSINTSSGTVNSSSIFDMGGEISLSAPNLITGSIVNFGTTGANITLTGDEINLNNTITGNGTLVLQPFTPSLNITIGGTTNNASLNLDTNKLNTIQNGFSQIIIGRENSSGVITFTGDTTFTDSVTLRSPYGSIIINNPIIGNSSVTLQGTTALNANITTTNQNIIIEGNTTLGNPVTLSTGTEEGNIQFNGSVNGTQPLTLATGTGNIQFNGEVGNTIPLATLTVSNASNLSLAGNLTTESDITLNTPATVTSNTKVESTSGNITFNQAITGNNTSITLQAEQNITTTDISTNGQNITLTSRNGSINTQAGTLNAGSIETGGEIQLNAANITPGNLTTTNNNITLNGSVILPDDISINGGNVTVNGTLNSAAGETNNLLINAGSGNITFTGTVGNIQPVGNINANSSSKTQFNTNVNANSVTTDEAGTTQLNGNITTTGNQIYNDVVILENNPVNLTSNAGNLAFNNTLDGNQLLTLDAQTIQFSSEVGSVTPLRELTVNRASNLTTSSNIFTSGNLTLNTPVTVTDDATFQSTSGSITTNGTITGTGDTTLAAASEINTTDINSRSLTLISNSGAIKTGNLNTSGTSGGQILIQSPTRITTGTINSSGTVGDGGNVILDPQGDVEVVSINAQGGNDGVGGTVDITTEQNFRATGTFIDRNNTLSSISTAGGVERGNVTIRHGGADKTAFVIGDATNNGTVAAITTNSSNRILPVQAMFGTVSQDKISIITSFVTSPNEPEITNPPEIPEIVDPNKNPVNQITKILADENEVYQADESLTSAVEQYYGLANTPRKTPQQIQSELSQIETATQGKVKPALIYVNFPNRQALLTVDPKLTLFVQLVVVTSKGESIRVFVPNVTQKEVQDVATNLRRELHSSSKIGRAVYNQYARQLYQWLIAPLEGILKEQEINNLVFIMDEGLRSLPLAALQDENGQYITERYSVGLMPSMSLTDTRYRSIADASVLAMGASEFPQSASLPGVEVEVPTIKSIQGRDSEAFLNPEFTRQNLESYHRQKSFPIIHLATHAIFIEGTVDSSYIEFYNEKLTLQQISTLQLNQPQVELLVLSACETAAGSISAELGFAGIAYQSGVKSVLASLWKVEDFGSVGLMLQFYRELQTAPTKADALRRAQIAMREGKIFIEQGMLFLPGLTEGIRLLAASVDRNFTHPYYWSGFTLVGNPW